MSKAIKTHVLVDIEVLEELKENALFLEALDFIGILAAPLGTLHGIYLWF